jgi:hypothetical protein
MEGYTKHHIRAAGVMPRDLVRIGDSLYRIKEYKQLAYGSGSTQLVLAAEEGPCDGTVLLTLGNGHLITVYSKE